MAAGAHLFRVDVLLWSRACALELDGEPAEALALLASVWDQTASLRGLLQYRNLGPDLVRLAQSQGNDGREPRQVADDMQLLADRSAVASVGAAARRARGLATGDCGVLVDAASRYRSTPRRVELAACCEEAAASLQPRRDTEGLEMLKEAAVIHLDLGAVTHLAHVDTRLRAHGIRRRRQGRESRRTDGQP